MKITSLQNPKVKDVIRLRNRRERDSSGHFLIEGYRELTRAHFGEQQLEQLFICPDLFLGANEGILIDKFKSQGTEITECAVNVFQKISYRDRPDGLLGIAPQTHKKLSDFNIASTNPFFVVAEAIEKPGNLGTILRSSDAVGVDGLIICDKCTDIHNPNVVRASVGTLFTVPVIESSSKETVEWLKNNKIKILAATPHADMDYTQVNLNQPLAIAIGTEQYGLSDQWMEQADIQVKIPMLGVADSLNVAMATTVLLYEVLRQRKQK